MTDGYQAIAKTVLTHSVARKKPTVAMILLLFEFNFTAEVK